MADPVNYVAISEDGVFEVCSDGVSNATLGEFVRRTLTAGVVIETMPTAQAIERYTEYLKLRPPEFLNRNKH